MEYLAGSKIYENIKLTLKEAQQKVYSTVNFVMVETYWNIGKQIYEAQGENERAEYGKGLLKFLSEKLTEEFGKGYTVTSLKYMRQFYMAFPNRHALRDQLSWTHYRMLLKVESDAARTFYLDECAKSNWSTRQLERQINSFYYQRLLSSQDKDSVRNEIRTLEKGIDAKDIIRDPYVLEFLGLEQAPNLYEKDIEQGLIDHLQKFLLELGRGFSFVSRQQHITFDGEHYYIDLVFYNYILKCFVIIDLKIGKLTHQDIGQMQMYVNYYTRELMNEGDNLPIGIVLCADKSDSVVKYTLPEDNNQIFASKYKLYMPTEEELKRELAKEQEFLETEKHLQ
ncbi:PDDEXK nuclease domain-containing protein [Anaerocolumna sp. AGMB13025]|uniref:PDDEXK nuclease domain-containing protein n=1 Tax=Anaerocolumna sp. AGMB13025 TaxID=3039116 RepID=UPI00241D94AD|nr:PDDEXK nuclease domain-containing protein [Anaerocolumna sp. AGMB13025]WFR55641.1 PDDEXK nuclease domain-containing protein [Anaerocolumna sp. AGMB13025]